jgi:hypothetical protein
MIVTFAKWIRRATLEEELLESGDGSGFAQGIRGLS